VRRLGAGVPPKNPIRLDALAAAAGELLEGIEGDPTVSVSGIAYDSKRATRDDLYCCVPGTVSDGHDFAPAAVASGATALLVERRLEPGVPQIIVADARRAMARIAAEFYGHPGEALTLVGITGTNGKTTTAYLVASVLEAAGHRTGLIGTIETRMGETTRPGVRTTPESVDLQGLLAEMRDEGISAVALEVTSHALALHRVEGLRFQAGVFTNLSQDHLDFHGSMEEYFQAKSALFLPQRVQKAAVNVDDPYGKKMLEAMSVPCLSFGLGPEAAVHAEQVKVTGVGNEFLVVSPQGETKVSSGLIGAFNVSNCLAAFAAGLQVGIDPVALERGLSEPLTVPGRFQAIDSGQPFTVVVDYAHTPDSLDNVLREARRLSYAGGGGGEPVRRLGAGVPPTKGGRLICVFGCGGDRDRGKRPLMGSVAVRGADVVVVTSDNPRSEKPRAIIDEILRGVTAASSRGADQVLVDRREAISWALAEARAGDVVVIAGKGHETGQEFSDRTIPFDDRAVARASLEELGWGKGKET
jgi:UDP-N-acetylmuramoyl-L-alanyl-D-glutamate--2,6-diaminopimelate ligase